MRDEHIRILDDGSLYAPIVCCPQCGEQSTWQHRANLYHSDHLFFTTFKTYRVYECGSCRCRFEVYDSTETEFHKIQSGWIAVLSAIIILGAVVALLLWFLDNLVANIQHSSLLTTYPFRSLVIILGALVLPLALIDWKESLDI